MLLLLNLLSADFLPATPAPNCNGLNRPFPLLVPKTLLLRRPNTFCSAIATNKRTVFIKQRRRVRIVRRLFAQVRLNPPPAWLRWLLLFTTHGSVRIFGRQLECPTNMAAEATRLYLIPQRRTVPRCQTERHRLFTSFCSDAFRRFAACSFQLEKTRQATTAVSNWRYQQAGLPASTTSPAQDE